MRSRIRNRVRLAGCFGLAASLVLVAACDAGSGGEGDSLPGTEPSSCSAPTLTDKPLRRLSNAELSNTLHALLGSDLAADLALPARVSAEDGFDADHQALQVGELVVDQLHDLAFEVSVRVADSPGLLLPCDPDKDEAEKCIEGFIADFLPRAFRRPLTTSQRQRYLALGKQLLSEEDLALTTGLLVQAALQSPEFLYRLQHVDGSGAIADSERFDDYTIASRLAYLVWQAPADDALLADAAGGRLGDAAVRAAHVQRMFADPRAQAPLREFARQWLGLRRVDGLVKDAESFPEFDAALARGMREQTERFVARTLAAQNASFGDLLTSRDVQCTPELAKLYGMNHSGQTEWEAMSLPATERAGLLTQGSLLAVGANQRDGSPIRRGVDVLRRVLCIEPAPPPEGFDAPQARPDDEGPVLTNRQQFENLVSAPECMSCHQVFDPIGYVFESFDAIGRYRTQDHGIAVDTRVMISQPTELAGEVMDAPELLQKIASSEVYGSCIHEKLRRFGQARSQGPDDRCRIDTDREQLASTDDSYLSLLLREVKRPDFIVRPRAEEDE